ncbi:MAG: peptidylprolyl isomerase [Gemmatimonadota bacterium]|nr:MAG: peptidylprolyl isomerase [Gemmatimonadota bacterium]
METGEVALPPDIGNPTPRVVLETSMGRIVMELDRDKAPNTVESILAHVRGEFYDGLIFQRVRPGFMIQAGAFTPEGRMRQSPAPLLQNESNNGLTNLRGTVAMARRDDPHSASTQFFINLVDNTHLDYQPETAETPLRWGYTVFARVVEGMDVVDAIAGVPTQQGTMSEAVPLEPIIIERTYEEGG